MKVEVEVLYNYTGAGVSTVYTDLGITPCRYRLNVFYITLAKLHGLVSYKYYQRYA